MIPEKAGPVALLFYLRLDSLVFFGKVNLCPLLTIAISLRFASTYTEV